MDIIDMESILTHSKNQDAIPSITDSKMTIEHGEIKVENALETTQVISIPGYYSGVSGIESYEITGN